MISDDIESRFKKLENQLSEFANTRETLIPVIKGHLDAIESEAFDIEAPCLGVPRIVQHVNELRSLVRKI